MLRAGKTCSFVQTPTVIYDVTIDPADAQHSLRPGFRLFSLEVRGTVAAPLSRIAGFNFKMAPA